MAPTILIAHEVDGTAVLAAALNEYHCVSVSTSEAANQQIKHGAIDLFIIGIHFDESRAIDLARRIREDNRHEKSPIILIRFSPSGIASAVRRSMHSLVSVGTVSHYLELEDMVEPQQIIRLTVDKFLKSHHR